MFGKKLEAEAVILEDEGSGRMMETDSHGVDWEHHTYVIEVRPAGEPAFRTESKAKVPILHSPNQGDVVKVLYDPKSHKAEIQIDGDPRFDPEVKRAQAKERDAQQRERAAALLDGQNPAPASPAVDKHVEAFANEMVRIGDHARWDVPAFCPECGARIDQTTASRMDHPTCEFCHKPLPATVPGSTAGDPEIDILGQIERLEQEIGDS